MKKYKVKVDFDSTQASTLFLIILVLSLYIWFVIILNTNITGLASMGLLTIFIIADFLLSTLITYITSPRVVYIK